MTCRITTQSDEQVCSTCVLRWDVREEKPQCPNENQDETCQYCRRNYYDCVCDVDYESGFE